MQPLTEMVYVVLRFYALGLAGHVCLELVARTFFVGQDTVMPLFLAIVFGGCQHRFGHPADAAAGLRRAGAGEFPGRHRRSDRPVVHPAPGAGATWRGANCWQRSAACWPRPLVMGGAIILTTQAAERGGFSPTLALAVSGITGVVVYFLAVRLLKVREIDRFVTAVLGR